MKNVKNKSHTFHTLHRDIQKGILLNTSHHSSLVGISVFITKMRSCTYPSPIPIKYSYLVKTK